MAPEPSLTGVDFSDLLATLTIHVPYKHMTPMEQAWFRLSLDTLVVEYEKGEHRDTRVINILRDASDYGRRNSSTS